MGWFSKLIGDPKQGLPTTPAAPPKHERSRLHPVRPEEAELFGMLQNIEQVTGDAMNLRVDFTRDAGHVCFSVVGESHYQDNLKGLMDALTLLGRKGHGFIATLVLQPDNPHDANAIAVTCGGNCLGYLPRDVAAELHPLLAPLAPPLDVLARLTGGTPEKPSIGVVLDLQHVVALRRS